MNTQTSRALQSAKRLCGVIVLCLATTTVSHAQTFTTPTSFNKTNGSAPMASLIQGPDGNFYGTTASGGIPLKSAWCAANGCGTVFKVTPSGQVTTLYSFCSQTNCTDGNDPWGALALGLNGNFYGTTAFGGPSNNNGTVFEISPQGKFTILHSFCSQSGCPDGSLPVGGLTLGPDGNFYGTTTDGGPTLGGTVYRISPTGNFSVLYSFCSLARCKDGTQPEGPLTLATNGKLYGTTPIGGIASGGTIFQLTLSGVDTTVHAFSYPNTDLISQSNGVMQAADGNLYGTTYEGPSNVFGSVFQLTPTGLYTTLHTFCSQTNCSDGVNPESQLVQGTDGNLYGTTAGNNTPEGSIFQITTTGNLTTLYTFCPQNFSCTDGKTPPAGLIQATNGNFYGVTSEGGDLSSCSDGCGTIFSFSMGLAPFVRPYPGFGRVGRSIGILGNNLTGTTDVTFNGTPATFTVVSSTFIKAMVPSGATTGTIQVTTPSRILNSNAAFQVLP